MAINLNKFKKSTILVKLADLKQSPFQPPFRTETAKKLAADIDKTGGVPNNIIIDKAFTIIDGHCRVAALIILGVTEWYCDQYDLIDSDGHIFYAINNSKQVTSSQLLSVYIRGGRVPDEVLAAIKLVETAHGGPDLDFLRKIENQKIAAGTVLSRLSAARSTVGPNHFSDKQIVDWIVTRAKIRKARSSETLEIPSASLRWFIENDQELVLFPKGEWTNGMKIVKKAFDAENKKSV